MRHSLRAGFVAMALAGLMALPDAGHATTVNIGTLQSGENLGAVTLATLGATQVGADVEFVLTNTTVGQPASFLTQLFLTYVGSQATASLLDVAGKATDGFSKAVSFTNAGLAFQFEINWPQSNKDAGVLRLKPGESSTFKILNTTLAGYFVDSDFAMVHIQGLNSGQSTKYKAVSSAVVPVPAAGLLLAGALGAFGLLRRRRAA